MTASVSGIPTKKALKALKGTSIEPYIVETSLFGPEFRPDGVTYLVGPSPTKRNWYAQIKCKCGVLMEVK